ncbi:MAG: sigma-70 family RNA polymerase sigma factor [Ktedonobacterales bacterium]
MAQQRGGDKLEQADARRRAEERVLVERSQHGDVAAFNQLVESHQAGAYALALRMLGDPDVAADVTQDAFFSAFRAIASFRGNSFRAWLFRIVSNGCFDHFRTQGRRPAVSLEATLEDDRDPDGPAASDYRMPQAMIDPSWDPEKVALRAETIAQIEAALRLLSPEQRLAVILSDIQGLPYEEIARIMDTSLGTVKSRIARARAHLRGILLRQGELFSPPGRPGNERDAW